MPSFGENLTRLRKARKLKGKQLAARVGVAPSVVSGWENDRRGLPETPTLFKLATALNCWIENLLAGIDADYERAIRQKMRDLQEALDRISDPDSSDDEWRDDDRRYDVRTVAELVAEITRDRDVASRAAAVRDAAAAIAMATTADERLVLEAYRQAKQSALGLDGEKRQPRVPASNTTTVAPAGLARSGATGTDTKAAGTDTRGGKELVTADLHTDGQTALVASPETVNVSDRTPDVQGLVTDVLSRAAPRERERKAAARSREKPKRRQPARGTTRRRG